MDSCTRNRISFKCGLLRATYWIRAPFEQYRLTSFAFARTRLSPRPWSIIRSLLVLDRCWYSRTTPWEIETKSRCTCIDTYARDKAVRDSWRLIDLNTYLRAHDRHYSSTITWRELRRSIIGFLLIRATYSGKLFFVRDLYSQMW